MHSSAFSSFQPKAKHDSGAQSVSYLLQIRFPNVPCPAVTTQDAGLWLAAHSTCYRAALALLHAALCAPQCARWQLGEQYLAI